MNELWTHGESKINMVIYRECAIPPSLREILLAAPIPVPAGVAPATYLFRPLSAHKSGQAAPCTSTTGEDVN